jgi:hypothetical protein
MAAGMFGVPEDPVMLEFLDRHRIVSPGLAVVEAPVPSIR